MNITTKFNIGDLVKKSGGNLEYKIHSIEIKVIDGNTSVLYAIGLTNRTGKHYTTRIQENDLVKVDNSRQGNNQYFTEDDIPF